MNSPDIAIILRAGMLVMLKLAGPLLAVTLAVGLLVALVQAVTQINEATLVFVPKVIALGIALTLLGPFMEETISAYAHMLFAQLVAVGGS
ncbi:MAG TPA: flagellar biosynthetic protein FliQ [Acetobacteraceae bacterium]|jgi:flagellar biosynthetic protein FliQ